MHLDNGAATVRQVHKLDFAAASLDFNALLDTCDGDLCIVEQHVLDQFCRCRAIARSPFALGNALALGADIELGSYSGIHLSPSVELFLALEVQHFKGPLPEGHGLAIDLPVFFFDEAGTQLVIDSEKLVCSTLKVGFIDISGKNDATAKYDGLSESEPIA